MSLFQLFIHSAASISMMKTLPTSEFCNTYDYRCIFDGGRVEKNFGFKHHYDKFTALPSISVLNVLVYSL